MKLIWVLVPPYWVHEHDLEAYIAKPLGAFTTYEEALAAWEKLAEYGWPGTQTSIQQVALDDMKHITHYLESIDPPMTAQERYGYDFVDLAPGEEDE